MRVGFRPPEQAHQLARQARPRRCTAASCPGASGPSEPAARRSRGRSREGSDSRSRAEAGEGRGAEHRPACRRARPSASAPDRSPAPSDPSAGARARTCETHCSTSTVNTWSSSSGCSSWKLVRSSATTSGSSGSQCQWSPFRCTRTRPRTRSKSAHRQPTTSDRGALRPPSAGSPAARAQEPQPAPALARRDSAGRCLASASAAAGSCARDQRRSGLRPPPTRRTSAAQR